MTSAALLKYLEVGRITVRSRLAYIRDIFASTIFLAVVMFVFVRLWSVTYGAEGKSVIEGFTLVDMIWYLVATETIVMSMPATFRTIEREIREGDVAIRLNKPYNYLLFHLSVFIGEAVVKAVALILIGGTVAYLSVGGTRFDILTLPALFLTYVVTISLNFAYSSIIGLATFWFEDVSGLFFVMDRAKWLLGGFLIPVALFPEPLGTIAKLLPFRYMIGEPAKLFVKFDLTAWLEVLGLQFFFLLLIGGFSAGLYRLGVRRLNLNGG